MIAAFRLSLAIGLMLMTIVSVWAQAPRAQEERYQARISEVVDGDTVHLQPLGGRQEIKARLLGIDAPEICQAFGHEAHEALARRLNNMLVTVESDRQDDYGRALARIYLNGEDMGSWMVKQGLAWSYGAGRSKGPYRQDEQEAKAARRGLFAEADPMKPAQFRRKYKTCYPGHAPQLKGSHKRSSFCSTCGPGFGWQVARALPQQAFTFAKDVRKV